MWLVRGRGGVAPILPTTPAVSIQPTDRRRGWGWLQRQRSSSGAVLVHRQQGAGRVCNSNVICFPFPSPTRVAIHFCAEQILSHVSSRAVLSSGPRATFMKRPFRYAGLVLTLIAGGVAAQDQSKPATPAEQHQSLLKE